MSTRTRVARLVGRLVFLPGDAVYLLERVTGHTFTSDDRGLGQFTNWLVGLSWKVEDWIRRSERG